MASERRTRGSIKMMDDITEFIEAHRGSFALGYKEETEEWMACLEWKEPEEQTFLADDDAVKTMTVNMPHAVVGVESTAGDAIETMLKEAGL